MDITKKISQIIFYTKDKKILLQNREGYSKWGEEWAFFGGRIESGETPEQALIRETKEELSYDIKDFKLLKEIEYLKPAGYKVRRYIYISPLKNKTDKFEVKEGKGYKLFSIDEARKLKMIFGDNFILDALEDFLNNKVTK